MVDNKNECVVLTPKSKTANSTVLVVERQVTNGQNSGKGSVHVAGGEHHGIVVNKVPPRDEDDNDLTSDVSLEFRVYLVNAQTGVHTQESRSLQFWFKPSLPTHEHSSVAQHFFKDLVGSQQFPKGFIKKVMKLMQNPHTTIRKLEIELKQLEQPLSMPKRPLSADDSSLGINVELTEKKLLDIIESSYPNPVTIQEISTLYNWDEEVIKSHLKSLQDKGLVKSLEHGLAYTRVVQDDTDVRVVKQMPTISSSKQPIIAIITAQYCEKVAVDALIENKETFVRYTTVGESNVYTLGNIGSHRVVCTKLPTTGHTREAMIAAGNTTTRLLGTFQKVDHVFLVGVGGGVPHYTDYNKHVRLGDVVISNVTNDKKYIYTYCQNVKHNSDIDTYEFECKEYCPKTLILQDIATQLKSQSESECENIPWLQYLEDVISSLKKESEQDFSKPSSESDKLYMCIGERAIIEVAHPTPQENSNKLEGIPRIHIGPVASGRAALKDEQLRQAFALQCSAIAFDSEFDSVIESVIGSCRDSFIIIRGIADYKDGTRRTEWQPFASATAAAVVKSMIHAMDLPSV